MNAVIETKGYMENGDGMRSVESLEVQLSNPRTHTKVNKES